jgi:hypothetical protein
MAQPARSLGSDLAGAGTAMITCGAVPAPPPGHIGVSQISQMATRQDFADSGRWTVGIVARARLAAGGVDPDLGPAFAAAISGLRELSNPLPTGPRTARPRLLPRPPRR